MASVPRTKKCCIKCDSNGNNSGLFTCEGCQHMFCARHVNQHREELNNQLEIVVHQHDLIQQQFSELSSDHLLLQEIDSWEKKSILKIQKVAEIARNDLLKLIDNSNQRLSRLCQDIAKNLRLARKTDNFSEIDLEKWKEKLDKLKIDIESSNPCDLVKDKRSVIYLIKIEENNNVNHGDKFGQICGPVQLDQADMRSKYVGDGWHLGRIRGQQKYFQDRSAIKFKIEKSKSPHQLFFGITTSNADMDQRLWSASPTVGWCGENDTWRHGCYGEIMNRSTSDKFQSGDILQLILDCNRRQVELCNERAKTTHILQVDINETPFPWQFLLDCIMMVTV